MNFEQHIKELEQLESRANRYAWQLKNPQNSEKLWYEMQPQWQEKFDKIRTEFPEQWKRYCEQNNLVTNYNFGDVLA